METQFIQAVNVIVVFCAGIGAAYFIIQVCLALIGAQASASIGRPAALANAASQIFPALLCLLVLFGAQDVQRTVVELLSHGSATSPAGPARAWTAIAEQVVLVTVRGALGWIAIGIARGTISAQWAVTVGSSMGVSQSWTTIMMTIVTGALAAASPILIGLAADAIRPYVSTTVVLPRWTTTNAPGNAAGN